MPLSCLGALARTFRTMLSKVERKEVSALFLISGGEASGLSPLIVMSVVGFLSTSFIGLRRVIYTLSLLCVFIKEGCWVLSSLLTR